MAAAKSEKRNTTAPPGTGLILFLLLIGLTWAAALAWQRPVSHDAAPIDAPWPEMRIIINQATAAELQLLPGIGPALAERIVEDRAARGPFESLDDLQRVPMIGPVTVERIEPFVLLDAPAAE